jgi:DNA repair exonuclease SbcCD nuclease subunit
MHALSDIKQFIPFNKRIKIIDSVVSLIFDDAIFYCLPYLPPNANHNTISAVYYLNDLLNEDIIKEENKNKAHFFIGHFGINGAKVCSSDFIIKNEVTPNLLKNYDFAFMGDYHKNQKVVYNNIYYSGSIQSINFGELEQKYFNIIDVTNEILIIHKVSIKDRKYINFEVHYNKLNSLIEGDVIPIWYDAILKLNITGTPEQKYLFQENIMEFETKFKLKHNINYIIYKWINIDSTLVIKDSITTLENFDIKKSIKGWMKNNPPDQINKKMINKIIKKLIQL